MKATKLTAVLLAAAIAPLSLNTAPLLSASTVFAEDTAALAKLPDWIPNDFESATQFRNTFGAVQIQNGLICIVYPERVRKGSEKGTYGYKLKPTSNLGEALKQETYSNDYSETCFNVFVYQPKKHGDLELQIVDPFALSEDGDKPLTPPVISTYSFSVDESLTITETDIFSWLPDSITEYDDYRKKHGDVSARDNYIVFCLTSIPQLGDRWESDSTNIHENSKYLLSSDCTMQVRDMYVDGSYDNIYVYQAVKDGYEKISWTRTSNIRSDPQEPTSYTLTADSVILDDAHTVLLNGQTRVTVNDAKTGKTVSDEALASEPFTFHADIVYEPELFSSVDNSSANYSVTKNHSILQETTLCPSLSTLATAYKKADLFKITTEEQPEITYYDNGAMDLVFKRKSSSDLSAGETRITLYDKDTGELIPSAVLEHHTWHFGTDIRFKDGLTGPIYIVTSNPQIYNTDLARLYKNADYFAFLCDDQPEVTYHENGSMDLVFRTKVTVSGDVDGDGECSKSDLALLQNWLIGNTDAEISRWAEADFNLDNQLNALDLTLMKQNLLQKQKPSFIEPDEQIKWGSPYTVSDSLKDGLKLYRGPAETYEVIAVIPGRAHLTEHGYQHDLNDWMFTEYNGQYGWIHMVAEDGSPTVYCDAVAAKPVIYLYPEQETDVHVELELTESNLNTTYPKYNNGWDVTAYPDGSLVNKADGSHHKYLFWDAVNCRTRFDFSSGFCVAGSDTERFLKEKLTYMGLTEEEMNGFIVYWLPLMEHNAYNLIAFQGKAYTNSAGLTVTPAPDSECRIFMAYVPLEEAVEIKPQQLAPFERKGFSVIEWGGIEIRSCS